MLGVEKYKNDLPESSSQPLQKIYILNSAVSGSDRQLCHDVG
jgi:hypothetical protein